jgi:hypothetical protein
VRQGVAELDTIGFARERLFRHEQRRGSHAGLLGEAAHVAAHFGVDAGRAQTVRHERRIATERQEQQHALLDLGHRGRSVVRRAQSDPSICRR